MKPVDPVAPAHKKLVIEKCLEKGSTRIFLNSTIPGVQLPESLLNRPSIILDLSWKFGAYMELKDEGICADLSFSGQTQSCFLPWRCIWGVRDANDYTMVFTHSAPMGDLPPQILERKNRLEVIEGGGESTPPRTGHLKLLN